MVSNFLRAFKECGIACSLLKPPIVYAGHSTEVKAYFQQVRDALGGGDRGIPQLVVCLTSERTFSNRELLPPSCPEAGQLRLSGLSPDAWPPDDAIKKFGDNDVGCATQVLRIPKARKGQMA